MSCKKDLNDKLKKLKTLESRLFFYFPGKSRYYCRGTDIFPNIAELLIILYYTSMILLKQNVFERFQNFNFLLEYWSKMD